MPFQPGQSGNPMGKPKGAISKQRRAVQTIAEELGITPAEVMLRRMAELWERGTEDARDRAVQIAAIAAPYVHPRLAHERLEVEQREIAVISPEPLSVEEWATKYGRGVDLRGGHY
jgi:CO/xanthine dehydrogenase Mo-binding subunit